MKVVFLQRLKYHYKNGNSEKREIILNIFNVVLELRSSRQPNLTVKKEENTMTCQL